MQRDFDNMIKSDIPGQNWDCTLIDCHGNGIDNAIRHGEPARCVCYDKGGRSVLPTFRTSLNDPITMGMMVWIREQGMHYLLAKRPQKDVNCYSTQATPCNKDLTFIQNVPPTIDAEGYYITDSGGTREIVRDMPCVVNHSQQISNVQNTPGMTVEDVLTVTMQLNRHTKGIDVGAETVVDRQAYKVRDVLTEGTDSPCGLLMLTLQREAGSRQ